MIIFMKELIYQKFILGCQNLDDALKKGLGGVIFFTKDIKTTEQFKDLIKSIDIVEYNPINDKDNKTLKIVLELINKIVGQDNQIKQILSYSKNNSSLYIESFTIK